MKAYSLTDICTMLNAYCIALVFSRSTYRYKAYARQYAEALMALNKQVYIYCPFWIELHQELMLKFKQSASKIHCYPLAEPDFEIGNQSKLGLSSNLLKLRRLLHSAEKQHQTQVDIVFFAPAEDWIRPNYPKWLFGKLFPYTFSALVTQTEIYGKSELPINKDPLIQHPDYLLSHKNCIGVCTLDRFNTEPMRSRVYKKVLVMPDIADYDIPAAEIKMATLIKKMAKGRMVVGTLLLENEQPKNFLKLALASPPDNYFFVCSAEFEVSQLNQESKILLNQLLSSGKDNFYIAFDNRLDVATMNSLIQAIDVCYLNDYTGALPHPLMSKAAWFGKPIIGTKEKMAGKLLETFKNGIAVNGKTRESLDALQMLRLQMPFKLNFDLEKLKNYAKLQSQEALRQSLEELLWF